jgi:phosphate:Na+ symporter
VHTGILRLLGERLRTLLQARMGNRLRALSAGAAVARLVPSSTSSCLIVASFVAKGLVATAAAWR